MGLCLKCDAGCLRCSHSPKGSGYTRYLNCDECQVGYRMINGICINSNNGGLNRGSGTNTGNTGNTGNNGGSKSYVPFHLATGQVLFSWPY